MNNLKFILEKRWKLNPSQKPPEIRFHLVNNKELKPHINKEEN